MNTLYTHTSSPLQGSQEIVQITNFCCIQHFNPELVKEELIKWLKRTWEPSKIPWVLEDFETGHKTILWTGERETTLYIWIWN